MTEKPKRILHIAPQKISDVPMTLVRAERALGHESRLVTFFADARGYPEDYCMRLPFIVGAPARHFKKNVSDPARVQLSHLQKNTGATKPVWQPHTPTEHWLIKLRELLWLPKIRTMMRAVDFWQYDIYQLDAGLDFFRDGRTVRKLKALGKRLLVLYTGSDFRSRGVIAPVDDLADARFTVEWDHLQLDPTLHHVLFPFEAQKYSFREREAGMTVRIGHAPTNRAAKGSERILAVLQRLEKQRNIKIILIENKPHNEAIALKDKCDIFVDQIGDLGYGINALEALAMGIPTCTCLTSAFVQAYPQHPFVEVQAETLEQQLCFLIDHPQKRREFARKGRTWVAAHHDSRHIAKKIIGGI